MGNNTSSQVKAKKFGSINDPDNSRPGYYNNGKIIKTYKLNKPGQKVQVPALQWHTYVIRSDLAIIFETMMGKYDPLTFKKFPDWAPEEEHVLANQYFNSLKDLK